MSLNARTWILVIAWAVAFNLHSGIEPASLFVAMLAMTMVVSTLWYWLSYFDREAANWVVATAFILYLFAAASMMLVAVIAPHVQAVSFKVTP